jgi:hypothetical protein
MDVIVSGPQFRIDDIQAASHRAQMQSWCIALQILYTMAALQLKWRSVQLRAPAPLGRHLNQNAILT